jgi:hypothetical protein
LIHDSNTDVSNPPEYARTIFIVYLKICPRINANPCK